MHCTKTVKFKLQCTCVLFTCVTLCVSAALAVDACLSVTRQYCIETDKDVIELFLGLVAPPLWFTNTRYGCKILRGREACHWITGMLKFIKRSIADRISISVQRCE